MWAMCYVHGQNKVQSTGIVQGQKKDGSTGIVQEQKDGRVQGQNKDFRGVEEENTRLYKAKDKAMVIGGKR